MRIENTDFSASAFLLCPRCIRIFPRSSLPTPSSLPSLSLLFGNEISCHIFIYHDAPGSKYNNGGMQRNAFRLFLVGQIRKYTHRGLNIAPGCTSGMHYSGTRTSSGCRAERYANSRVAWWARRYYQDEI